MMTVVAGIDVSRSRLDVHVAGEDRRIADPRGGYRALGTWLEGHRVTRVAMESTGCYQRAVHQSLHVKGLRGGARQAVAHASLRRGARSARENRYHRRRGLGRLGMAFLDLPATPP